MMIMQQSIKTGKRLSLSLDEYSSPNHERYLNINVLQEEDIFWIFGMFAINGRMTAEKTVEEVQSKLSGFSLSLIINIIINCNYLLCG